MQTALDPRDELLHRVTVFAAERHTMLKELVVVGLDWVRRPDVAASRRDELIDRLKRGLHLDGKPRAS